MHKQQQQQPNQCGKKIQKDSLDIVVQQYVEMELAYIFPNDGSVSI